MAPDAAAPRERSTTYLALAITSLALAAGFEGLAWAGFAQSNNQEQHKVGSWPEVVIAGHVLAGAMAVTSGVMFYLWYTSDEAETPASSARVMVTPLPGGAALSGGFRF